MNRWTKLVHFNNKLQDKYHANSIPIYQTATFAQPSSMEWGEYDYSRSGNPTRTVLENYLAELEEAKYGFAFTSGMAAIHAVTQLLQQDDQILFGHDIYGGTHRLLTKLVKLTGINIRQVETTHPTAVANAITSQTRLLLIETPSNPLHYITDIKKLAGFLHERNILLAVDNSLMSPWLQQPLTLGADIVIHSATKHLSGHSDVTAGFLAVNDENLAERLAFIQNATGTALAPFPAWLLLRGAKTLGLRIERQQTNAESVANYLAHHPEVKKVYYPGLKDHPNYVVHKQQTRGPGTVISFTTGSIEKSRRIVDSTQLFKISVSFGNLTSLISLPFYMSHASIAQNERQLPQDLIRLSIGIEDPQDLQNDLVRCLEHCKTE